MAFRGQSTKYKCLENFALYGSSSVTPTLHCRYMKRRCEFLDSFSAFNYNTGIGEYLVNEQGHKVTTSTQQLGSTLMRTMLKEVSDFCDPKIKDNWSMEPHQQVRTSTRVSIHIVD